MMGLIRLMVGRQIEDYFPPLGAGGGAALLEVRGLQRTGRLADISFQLRAGEILGLAGLVGSGRNLLARCLLGLEPHDGGEILLRGSRYAARGFRQAMKAGFGYITDDRKALGILGPRSLKENLTIANLQSYLAWGFLRRRRENAAARAQVLRLAIRSSGIGQSAQTLSGGNQQKVLIARWLLREPEVFIFSEPTRGVDVGAKAEIYRIMRELTAAGKAILMISSELPEVIGMSDRVLVMQGGRIRGTLDQREARATEEGIMSLAVGHTYSLGQGGAAK
jgi:ribose transport system ATP-binding protein